MCSNTNIRCYVAHHQQECIPLQISISSLYRLFADISLARLCSSGEGGDKSIEKTAYVLGSELWEYDFDNLLSLVKEYVVGVWDACKQKVYGDDSCPSQLQSLAEDLQLTGVEGQTGQMVKNLPVCTCMCGSTHDASVWSGGSSAIVAS